MDKLSSFEAHDDDDDEGDDDGRMELGKEAKSFSKQLYLQARLYQKEKEINAVFGK